MVLVSLVFLLVYLFGAYAYGAATLFASREAAPVWTHARPEPSGHSRIDRATFALFVVSTIWFVPLYSSLFCSFPPWLLARTTLPKMN